MKIDFIDKVSTMKKIVCLQIIMLFLNFVVAQEVLPEFNNKPAFWDSKSKQLVELEKSGYNSMAKAKGLFKAEGGYYLEGNSSKVKLGQQAELKFIVKVKPGEDPSGIFDLAQFEVRKEQRVYITTTAKTTSTSTSIKKIDYEVRKVKDGYYYLLVKNLGKGEYFFGSSEAMFAFSVE